MRTRHWPILAAVVLAVLWARAEADRWRLRREVGRIYLGDVTVQAVDADTKAPLKIVFDSPGFTTDQRWPKAFSVAGTGDPSKLAIRWVDVGDVDAAISADGFERVPLKLNAATPRELVIPLRRARRAD
jgi:hypothetical protein